MKKVLHGSVSHTEETIKELRADRRFAVEYLKAALEELDDPDNRAAGLLALRDVAELGVTEPEHINHAMLTELDALRAARAAEAEELSEIIAALNPLIEEAAANA